MSQREKQPPLRTCAACRERRPQQELIRITASKDGSVAVDTTGKLPGRGAYLCNRAACCGLARKRGSLRRALKCPVPEEIWQDIERIILAGRSD